MESQDQLPPKGIWKRFLYALGYFDEPIKLEGINISLPAEVSVKEPDGGRLLIRHVNAVFQNQKIDMTVKAPPLCGREWWSDYSAPKLKDKDVVEGWKEIVKLGDLSELLAWTETVVFPDLTNTFVDALVSFQYQETLINDNHACPLRWGVLAYQAAIAAYNTTWLAAVRLAGATELQVSRERQLTHLWLESAACSATVSSGDFYLLDRFYRSLEQQHSKYERIYRNAKEKHEITESHLEFTRSKQGEAIFPWTRLAARSQVTEARKEEHKALLELQQAQAARSELEGVLSRWRALNPVTALLQPARGNSGNKITSLPLSSLCADESAEGLQQWLIRHMVRACLLVEGESLTLNEALLRIFENLLPRDIPAPKEEPWTVLTFLLRFYRLWALSCPAVEQVKATVPAVNEKQQNYYRTFFGPWKRLRSTYRRIRNQPRDILSNPQQIFRDDFEEICSSKSHKEDWNKMYNVPLPGSLEEKIDELRAHLSNVIRMQTKLGTGGDSYAEQASAR